MARPSRKRAGTFCFVFFLVYDMGESGSHDGMGWKRVESLLLDFFHKKKKEFSDLWSRIGIPLDQQEARVESIAKYVKDLLDDMTQEEEGYEKRLLTNISSLQNQVNMACQELSKPIFYIDPSWKYLYLEAALKSGLTKLNREKSEKLKRYDELHKQEIDLATKLGISPPEKLNTVPTESELATLETTLGNLQNDYKIRFEQVSQLICKIVEIYDIMNKYPNSETYKQLVVNWKTVPISDENISKIKLILDDAEFEHQEFVNKIDILWASIGYYWKSMDTPPHEIEQFKIANSSYTSTVLQTLLLEEEKLKTIRKNTLVTRINGIRSDISSLWDECLFGPAQRQTFPAIMSDSFSEDLLMTHEQELERLKAYFDKIKNILEMIKRRSFLWKKMWEFETHKESASRLLNRGGALLKEEKLRKTVVRDLPVLESELIPLIEQWESCEQIPLVINDERYIDTIYSQHDALTKEKEMIKMNRRAKKLEATSCLRYATPSKRNVDVSTYNSFTSMKTSCTEKSTPKSILTPLPKISFETPKSSNTQHRTFCSKTPIVGVSFSSVPTPSSYYSCSSSFINQSTTQNILTLNRRLLIESKKCSPKVSATTPRKVVKEESISEQNSKFQNLSSTPKSNKKSIPTPSKDQENVPESASDEICRKKIKIK